MTSNFSVLAALAAGLTINVLDVGCTLLFAAKPWEKELRRQGLEPRKQTPPYYVATNFVGGLVLAFEYQHFSNSMGDSAATALKASFIVWFATRIYGGGHVVMAKCRQEYSQSCQQASRWDTSLQEPYCAPSANTSPKNQQCGHLRGVDG
jgi:hypothetical protein